MDWIREFKGGVPRSPSDEIDWDRMERLFAPAGFAAMKETPQNPVYHGEGGVYAHTQLVCRELVKTPSFYGLPSERRTELFLSAVLHDIGKTKTTRMENGAWISLNHAAAGSRIVREFLWRDCGLCGTPEAMNFRETVCALIRYHMLPVHLPEKENAERRARETACIGELASGFTWDLLCRLAEADVRGRIAGDTAELLEQVQLARLLAEETDCLYGPYRFAGACTRRAYLSGRNVCPDQTLYDASWGEVILMAGLPGTGKDTWIRENAPNLPMVSPDEIRRRNGIKPADDQGRVIQAAQETAKEYLRKRQPFVWNATDIARDTRQKLTGLFERYGARVRIVYLETGWQNRLERNAGRPETVPETAVGRMLERMVPPMPDEAQTVEWVCV